VTISVGIFLLGLIVTIIYTLSTAIWESSISN
jgi:hypothetical protein